MQQNNSKQSNQSEIELDFIGILRILLNSKRSIILCTIVAAAIGWAYSLYFNPILPPPTYKTTAVMELGSYPASDAELSIARDGRILIASMDASTSLLMALFGKERNQLTSDLLSQQVLMI